MRVLVLLYSFRATYVAAAMPLPVQEEAFTDRQELSAEPDKRVAPVNANALLVGLTAMSDVEAASAKRSRPPRERRR